MGDVHAQGNPHYMLDPRNGVSVARGISERFSQIDPENSRFYKRNYIKFKNKLQNKIIDWEDQLNNYKGLNIITYHKTWIYFLNWAGFNYLTSIEPKPGIPPSPSDIIRIANIAKEYDKKLIITANYFPTRTGKLIAKKIDSSFLSLPVMVEGNKEVTSYVELFDYIIKKIQSNI